MELDRVERYYKYHARLYDWTRPLFLFDRKKAIDMLGVSEGDTVIDIACGTGMNIPYLLEKKVRVIGVDYVSSMLQRAKEKHPSIQFIQSDVATFQIPEIIDAIICTYALSMIEEWQKAILNMKHMLKKDGRLVILDFHPWQGAASMFYPIFRWWLKLHGVNPEKDLVPFLQRHFTQVDVQVRHSGYDYIIRASAPIDPVLRD